MHCSRHACDEAIDTVRFLDERDQRSDSTLIVTALLEQCENEFLKGIDLILQCHEILDGLISGPEHGPEHLSERFTIKASMLTLHLGYRYP